MAQETYRYVRFQGFGDNTGAVTTRLSELQAIEDGTGTNRLLNKIPISGEAVSTGGAFAKITDGTASMVSGEYSVWWVATGVPTLVYDLGALYALKQLNIWAYSKTVDIRAPKFILWVSKDNSNWTQVIDYSGNVANQPEVAGFSFATPIAQAGGVAVALTPDVRIQSSAWAWGDVLYSATPLKVSGAIKAIGKVIDATAIKDIGLLTPPIKSFSKLKDPLLSESVIITTSPIKGKSKIVDSTTDIVRAGIVLTTSPIKAKSRTIDPTLTDSFHITASPIGAKSKKIDPVLSSSFGLLSTLNKAYSKTKDSSLIISAGLTGSIKAKSRTIDPALSKSFNMSTDPIKTFTKLKDPTLSKSFGMIVPAIKGITKTKDTGIVSQVSLISSYQLRFVSDTNNNTIMDRQVLLPPMNPKKGVVTIQTTSLLNLTATGTVYQVNFDYYANNGGLNLPPSDWTPRMTQLNQNWIVRSGKVGAMDNITLESTGTDPTNGRTRIMNSYNPVSNYTGDFDMVMKWRSTDATAGAIVGRIWSNASGSETNADHQGYSAYVKNDKTLTLTKYKGTTFSTMASVSYPAYTVGNWYWVRLRRRTVGAQVFFSSDIWADGTGQTNPDDTSTWLIANKEDTNLQSVTPYQGGNYGVGAGDFAGVRDFDYWGMGTEELSAIVPNPLFGQKASAKSRVITADLTKIVGLPVSAVISAKSKIASTSLLRAYPISVNPVKAFSKVFTGSILKGVPFASDPIKGFSKVSSAPLLKSFGLAGTTVTKSKLVDPILSKVSPLTASIVSAKSKVTGAMDRAGVTVLVGSISAKSKASGILIQSQALSSKISTVSKLKNVALSVSAPSGLAGFIRATSKAKDAVMNVQMKFPASVLKAYSKVNQPNLNRATPLPISTVQAKSRIGQSVIGQITTMSPQAVKAQSKIIADLAVRIGILLSGSIRADSSATATISKLTGLLASKISAKANIEGLLIRDMPLNGQIIARTDVAGNLTVWMQIHLETDPINARSQVGAKLKLIVFMHEISRCVEVNRSILAEVQIMRSVDQRSEVTRAISELIDIGGESIGCKK